MKNTAEATLRMTSSETAVVGSPTEVSGKGVGKKRTADHSMVEQSTLAFNQQRTRAI